MHFDHVTLTFNISTPKLCHFHGIRKSFRIPSLNTLGSFFFENLYSPYNGSNIKCKKNLTFFELCCRQTDTGTNKQTDRQTDGLEHHTQADRHNRCGNNLQIYMYMAGDEYYIGYHCSGKTYNVYYATAHGARYGSTSNSVSAVADRPRKAAQTAVR